MNKSRSLTLIVCLAVAACTGSKQKTTWQKVREITPDKTPTTADASSAFANKLHKMLLENKVEHKVVTFQFRYQTRMREEAVGTRSAVVYKDDSDPRNPWWMANEQTANPVWLPGTDLKKQVAFYLQRPAEIMEQKPFSGGGPQPTGTMVATNHPVIPARDHAVTQIAKTKRAPAVETVVVQAAPKIEPAPFIRPARFSPEAPGVAIPYTTPAREAFPYDDVFRRAHGTDYDRSSPLDRRKMETIKHTLLDTSEPSMTRTRVF